MKWASVSVCVALIGFAASLTAAAATSSGKCAPNTSWNDACNWCHCSESGHALCTKRGCESPAVLQAPPATPLAECLAGSSWESGCHRCACTAAGQAECVRSPSCADESVAGAEPARCKPNTTFVRDCNTCTCLDNGLALCSLRGCLHLSSPASPASVDSTPEMTGSGSTEVSESEEIIPLQKTVKKREVCTPGEVIQRECNTCRCIEDGTDLACTKRACVVSVPTDVAAPQVQVYNDRLKREIVCKPNEIFQHECNTCTCDAEGATYTCTHNECMDKPDDSSNRDVEVFMENEGTDHIERHSVCQPRSTFNINCHTCQCNYDGSDYRCTDEACPLPDDVELFKELQDETHIVPLKRCDPTDDVAHDGCGDCRCDGDSDYKCSKTNCKRRRDKQTKQVGKSNANKSVVCQANKAFQKDCNTCWCNEDGTGYFCTRKVCVPNLPEDAEPTDQPEELRIIRKECRPDEVFELDCNMCRCNADGKSFSCTRRACVTDAPPDAVDFQAKTSGAAAEGNTVAQARRVKRQEGKTFPTPTPVKACEPGLQFRVDCNTCLCNAQGQDFSCTRKDCTVPPSATSRRRRREVGSQDKTDCEPGSVFLQDCNVCRCTSDGRHAACKLKQCAASAEPTKTQGPEAESGFRCSPGEQFKRSCNDCTCSADGKSVFCTIKLCEKEIVSQL